MMMMKANDPQPSSNHHEDPNDMTYSRRIARYLSRFSLYYPQKDHVEGEGGGPNLDMAWSYYEHVTLARCYYNNNNQFENDFVRAPQSEREIPTKLYPVISTPLKELMDFGVSQRMFFSSLLALSAMMFLAGLLNIPMMVYFHGYAGEEGKDGVDYYGTGMIRSSALCDASEWVKCDTCNDHPEEYPAYRLDGTNVRRNLCDFDNWLVPGLCSYASTVLLLTLMGVAFWKQRAAEIVFDEDVQTASDYSIKVTNPPPDATNPDEWKEFFNQYACDNHKGVVLVTVALNNSKLVRALINRRQKLKQLQKQLPLGTNMDDRALVLNLAVLSGENWLSILSCGLVSRSARRLWSDIQHLEDDIRVLSQDESYKAVTVFVTFETERAQRNALHALSTGRLHVWRNQLDRTKFGEDGILRAFEAIEKSSMWSLGEPEKKRMALLKLTTSSGSNCSGFLMFRNYKVLSTKEAEEPSDVRWNDLQASNKKRLELYAGSIIGMIVFVMWSGIFIYRLVKNYPAEYATLFITMTNVAVPVLCEQINDFESHPTEHGSQTSLYVKITIFRWFNSVIALSLISSFVESISVEDGNEEMHESLIYKVYAVILAELFCKPIVDILDLPQAFKKHVLAPRARDQEEMNACFSGGRFWLAERYTDLNKVLFVALFFSSILPEAFFLGAFALLAQFCVSKLVLLRYCGRTPDVSFYLSRVTRNFFIPFMLMMHVIMSAYWWSGYPYDSVCASENQENNGGYSSYFYCSQNFYSDGIFPPLPRFQPEGAKWMSASQEVITSLYGWTSVVVIFVAGICFLQNAIIPGIRSIYEGTYVPDGADQGINFSSVMHLDEVNAYVPQVRVKGFTFPMLACDISGIDEPENLLGWRDKVRGYDAHNLVNDLHTITRGRKPLHPIFSIVKQYDPNVK